LAFENDAQTIDHNKRTADMGLDNMTQKALASRFNRLYQVLTVCLAILVVLPLLSFLGAYNQFCEVLSHFVFFYFLLSLVGFSLAMWLRLKAAMAMALVVLVLNIARLGPQYLPVAHTPPAGAECIRIMALNCEGRKNQNPDQIYKIACRENADVVCFSEIDDKLMQRINATFERYTLPDSVASKASRSIRLKIGPAHLYFSSRVKPLALRQRESYTGKAGLTASLIDRGRNDNSWQ
jgi:endonuclease/exonuclease/phosphatase (EEP) superfamily protein YafD